MNGVAETSPCFYTQYVHKMSQIEKKAIRKMNKFVYET